MTLEKYLAQTDTSQEDFAALIGASQAAVSRYVSGKRFPTRRMIGRISDVTKGMVAPADWFPLVEAA